MTAGSEKAETKRRRGRGRPFQKGQSGNPKGMSKEAQARRREVRDLLDEAFLEVRPDGTVKDLLVESLKRGVRKGDSTCHKLVCAYRWGKPPQEVELNVNNMSLEELKRRAAEILGDE